MAGKTPYVLPYSGREVEDLLTKTNSMPEPATIASKTDVQQAENRLQEEIDQISGISVYSATTAEWNAQPTLVSEKNAIYVYIDYDTEDGQPVPAIKIGNGTSLLSTLPFATANGITTSQVEEWDNKVTAEVDGDTLSLY